MTDLINTGNTLIVLSVLFYSLLNFKELKKRRLVINTGLFLFSLLIYLGGAMMLIIATKNHIVVRIFPAIIMLITLLWAFLADGKYLQGIKFRKKLFYLWLLFIITIGIQIVVIIS